LKITRQKFFPYFRHLLGKTEIIGNTYPATTQNEQTIINEKLTGNVSKYNTVSTGLYLQTQHGLWWRGFCRHNKEQAGVNFTYSLKIDFELFLY
jgi:hypothetical protein